ncbi:MAG: GDP-mannose 4,6-dehydratase [Spirochaetales bacterium]|nr:GDP-mannose 4,6-dehydratase [Spirochaetales bacterium]
MNILLTGGAGFIGSNLLKLLLAEKHNVVVIDNFVDNYDYKFKIVNLLNVCGENADNFSFHSKMEDISSIKKKIGKLCSLVTIDICDKFSLEKVFKQNEFDLVIHLAALAGVRPSIEMPESYIDVNILGTLNILELQKKYNCKKIIFASSSSVYGNNREIPFSEEHSVDKVISQYAFTKKSCENLIHVYSHLYNFSAVMLRFFTVYGPGQRPDLAIHKFFNKIYNDEIIDIYGDGSSSRDYTYVDDIVAGIYNSCDLVMSNDSIYEIINLGENTSIGLNEMVEAIESALNKVSIKRNLPMMPGDVDCTFADIEKARNILKYSPSTIFSDGIRTFKNWYISNNINRLWK